MIRSQTRFLSRPGKADIAYVYTPPANGYQDKPVVMFCGGFRSDMQGTKATYLEEMCRENGQGYIRFDYSGHGKSGGDFKDCTISTWFDDACAVLDTLPDCPVVIVGSSMGGWIALLLAKCRPERIKGIIGVAAAPDFTQRLYEEELSAQQREIVERQGQIEIPNDYSDEPYIFTKKLFDDGADNFVLNSQSDVGFPIYLFHGISDTVVPLEAPLKIKEKYKINGADGVEVEFIDGGDHSLSRPQDLEALWRKVIDFSL